MSIKLRLLLSYIAMLIIPIISTVTIGYIAATYYFGEIDNTYSEKFAIAGLQENINESEQIFSDIKLLSTKNTEILKDKVYIGTVEEQLNSYGTGIIVRIDDNIIFKSKISDKYNVKESLPKFGEYFLDRTHPFKNKYSEMILDNHDFYFDDGTQGSIYLITDIEKYKNITKKLIITIIIAIIIILCVTNGLLTYFVARSIINPLNKLKDSANKIKNGNLDFVVDINKRDELGEVSVAFDEMRKKLKESEELQEQYEDNRKELISNISHDLKTPITAIKGYVEGIKDGIADTPEKMNKYINIIYTKTIDVDRLINELFLYSKLDLCKIEYDFREIDIVEFLNDSIEELQFDTEKRNMKLEFAMPVLENKKIIADTQQLKRVIINIVQNSIKYMDKDNGKIEISLKEYKNNIRIAIKDNGKGISKEALPYVFNRFYREDSARNTLTGGSGLGLSIAEKIITQHGGDIWIESDLGKGTTIFLTLKKVIKGD